MTLAPQPNPPNYSGRLARAALFASLWFLATFYFCGDLGKWMDDWFWHFQDPATGSPRWSALFSRDAFDTHLWRMLHVRCATSMQTLFWSHDWASHLTLALLHGLNAWLVWRVLSRLCSSRQAPALGALLFLVYPGGNEAIFWVSTVGTPVGVCCLLICTLAVQRFAVGKGLRGSTQIGWRSLLPYAPLLLTLGWWYESAAAAAPAIALAYLACVPSSIPVRRRLSIAAGLFAAAMFAGILCAGLVVWSMPSGARGGAGSLVKANELVPQVTLILQQAWQYLALINFAAGALHEGWRAFCSRPYEALIVGASLIVALFIFGQWWMRGQNPPSPSTTVSAALDRANPTRFQRLCTVGFGLAISAASILPAVMINGQWFASRLAYTPALGLILAFAALVDLPLSTPWAQARGPSGRVLRAAALAALLPSLICGALMLLGEQSVWHKRLARDRRMAQDLRALVPNPDPKTVFVPIDVRGWPTATSSRTFDSTGSGPFEYHWTARPFVQFSYRRADIYSLGFHRWLMSNGSHVVGCVSGSDAGLTLGAGVLPAATFPLHTGAQVTVPWSDIITFRVDKGAHIHLVDSVRIEDPQSPVFDQVITLSHPAPNPVKPFIVTGAATPHRPVIQPAWRLVAADGREPASGAAPALATAGERQWLAFTMHPVVGAIPDRGELRASIEPSAHPQTIAMRAIILDHALSRSDGVTVSIQIEGAALPLARETITPQRIRAQGGWIVVRADLPPASAPRTLHVLIDPGPANDADTDWCYVTPPVLTSADELPVR